MNAPKRQYELKITIGGDEWMDVVYALCSLADHVEEHGPNCAFVSASPRDSSSVLIEHNQEMTHDRYHEELRAYLRAKREAT